MWTLSSEFLIGLGHHGKDADSGIAGTVELFL